MKKFELLCVTMHQNDFSKIAEMNIHSNVIFANQCNRTAYDEMEFEGHIAKMISTQTKGVGKNRNIALLYASAEFCLFADDDVQYVDDLENIVTKEFELHPNADIMIFHVDTDDPVRKQKKYSKTRKCKLFERMPWGAVRIAVRLSSVRKANVWFTDLFGGGCIFPSGEDSLWLLDVKKKGLKFYVSNKTIGAVSVAESTWFTGFDERYFFGKGAYYQAAHKKTFLLWSLYFAFRTRKRTKLTFKERIRWMRKGRIGYKKMLSFEDYQKAYDA
ncbi:MAG: hypothetical protein J6A38_01465 [Clostridia bacterium]|nr:hypothetical protein [Clostridia bacterium]